MPNIFICPASDSLNKHNETGSVGQLSYELVRSIGEALPDSYVYAIVMNSHNVNSFSNVIVSSLFKENYKRGSKASFTFYIASYLRYLFSSKYRSSKVVYHIMPFAPGLSFNLFFLLRSKRKKYVLGPILGPHTDLVNLKDEMAGADSKFLKKIASILLGGLSRKTIHNADLVLFPDRYAYRSFKDYLKPGQDYKFLEFGISSDIYKTADNPTKKTNKLKILYVGRLTERKGCIYLIEALKKIGSEQVKRKLIVDILSDGPQMDYLKQKTHEYGLQDVVTFHGGFTGNDEINKFYNSADILVLPSLSDTWMSVKEGLMCGLPVITTDIASHGEHIKNGQNGFLIRPRDSEAIARHIMSLVDDRELLKGMSEAAHTQAIKRYNWRAIALTYKKYLDNLLR